MSGSRIYATLSIVGLVFGLAVPVLAEKAPDCDSVAACSSLAPAAAGPALLRLLQDENWDTRVEAALALGDIAYKPSASELVKALASEADWQLAYAATIGLSRLQDASALKPLREAAGSYWYPPVRAAADCAAQLVESGKPCARHDEILNLDLSGLQTIRADANCSNKAYPKASEPEAMKRYGNEEALQEFKYTGAECEWYGDVDKATGSRACLARRIIYPKMAARTADGWLTGRDQEGGELMFFPDKGKPYQILTANVEDIYVLERDVVALTGSNNETGNRGMVYRLRKDGAGKWESEPLLRLPGAAESSYKAPKEEIFVDSYGVKIVFDGQGKPRMALCGRTKK